MKTLIKAALAATAATALFASPALAAPSFAAADFVANAKIVKGVTINKNFDLDFGTITMNNTLTSQTVTVSQANIKSCGGAMLSCVFPAQAAATFTVTGVPSQSLDVTLVAPTELTNADGDVLAFGADYPSSITVPAAGTVDFGIGGNVTVVSATKDGDYSGDLEVTVTYQ